jgi:hypothetical protein
MVGSLKIGQGRVKKTGKTIAPTYGAAMLAVPKDYG